MKTLLTTDGSEYATTAIVAASRLLVRSGNTFDMMCVIPEFQPPARSPGIDADDELRLRVDYGARMRAEVERALDSAARTLGPAGIEAQQIIEMGSPADVLVERAGDYDVVVAGVHHSRERPGPGLGPVASRLLERASSTVLIGRGLANEKSFRILLPVDGSAASENAVEALASRFRLVDADITVMHVIERPWLRLDLEAEEGDETEIGALFSGELRREADEIIAATRRRLSGLSASTEALVVDGNPASEIIRHAEMGEYDLAVVGATGVSDLKHTLLGSVSFRLASNAPCSVAVVR